ncbi:MAG: hypothetical protein LC802_18865 [Acidobacteria bacterium]|nr:hypothetical protein [Acidobacteriota bacterium]
MSQNRPDNDKTTTGAGSGSGSGTSGGATGDPSQWGTKATGAGGSDAGTTREHGGSGSGLTTTAGSTSSGGGAATGTATGLAAQAKEYGQKVSERNVDYGQLAEDAKQYARQKPGQALLISAAAGFVIGLLLRGGSRR